MDNLCLLRATVEHWVWDTFETTPVMSTYLVACVLTEFGHVETVYHSISGKDVPIRLWTHRHRLAHLDFALNLIPKALERLEDYTGIPYSAMLPKLDVVALPGYEEGKAMENWGLIIHSEMNLLVDDTTDSIDKSIVGSFFRFHFMPEKDLQVKLIRFSFQRLLLFMNSLTNGLAISYQLLRGTIYGELI